MKRVLIISLFTLLFGILLLLVGCGKDDKSSPSGFNSSGNRKVDSFCELLSGQKYDMAFNAYSELLPEEKTSVHWWMKEYVVEIEKKYYEGVYDYSVSSVALENLKKYAAVYDVSTRILKEITVDYEYEVRLERANVAFSEGNWIEAYDILLGIDPHYRKYDEALKLSNDCENQYKSEVLGLCEDAAQRDAIAEAIKILDEATATLPYDVELSEAWNKYVNMFVQTSIERAEKLAMQNDYKGAQEILLSAQEIFDSHEIAVLLDKYFAEQVEQYCLALEQKGDLTGIMQHLQSLNTPEALSNEKIAALREKYGDQFEKWAVEKAAQYAEKREFEKAIEHLRNVKLSYERPVFEELITEYSESLPRKLTDCVCVATSGNCEIDIGWDHFGNVYERILEGVEYGGKPSRAIFYLGGRFVLLEGKLVAGSMATLLQATVCRIYADEVLIYESIDIFQDTLPVDVRIDIAGVQQLEIEFENGADNGYTLNKTYVIADLKVS